MGLRNFDVLLYLANKVSIMDPRRDKPKAIAPTKFFFGIDGTYSMLKIKAQVFQRDRIIAEVLSLNSWFVLFCFCCFTSQVKAGRSVHLTTLFLGQA